MQNVKRIQHLKDALRLLSKVPVSRWTPTAFTNGRRCCAIGNYERMTSANPKDYSLNNCNDYKNPRGLREIMVTDVVIMALRNPPRKTFKHKVLKAIKNDIKTLR